MRLSCGIEKCKTFSSMNRATTGPLRVGVGLPTILCRGLIPEIRQLHYLSRPKLRDYKGENFFFTKPGKRGLIFLHGQYPDKTQRCHLLLYNCLSGHGFSEKTTSYIYRMNNGYLREGAF